MPITTRRPAQPSALQKFRTITEEYLLQVAQRELLHDHPDAGVSPAPHKGLIYNLLPIIFMPGFRLTPWPIKRRLLSWFFVHREQKWPERPWEETEPEQ